MSRPITESEATALRNEHASLDREIAEWRTWWEELYQMGQPHFGEMGNRLAQLREHLAAHFAHEESLGCLSTVMDRPPDVIERIAQLREEHARLLSDLDHLITRLQACEPQFDCWGNARAEFEVYLDRLSAHERAEADLLEFT